MAQVTELGLNSFLVFANVLDGDFNVSFHSTMLASQKVPTPGHSSWHYTVRSLLFSVVLLLLGPIPVSALLIDADTPERITFEFAKAKTTVVLQLNKSSVTSVSFRRGFRGGLLPANVCQKLHTIRLDTVRILSEEGSNSYKRGGAVSLCFDMGKEEVRTFGSLPRVRLRFKGGKFCGGEITRKVSEVAFETEALP